MGFSIEQYLNGFTVVTHMTLVASEGGLVSRGLLWDHKAAPDFVCRITVDKVKP